MVVAAEKPKPQEKAPEKKEQPTPDKPVEKEDRVKMSSVLGDLVSLAQGPDSLSDVLKSINKDREDRAAKDGLVMHRTL